jgi:hypothetical protein
LIPPPGAASQLKKCRHNKKAEDFSSASLWLVPSPRHLAKPKSYCNGVSLVVQEPAAMAAML